MTPDLRRSLLRSCLDAALAAVEPAAAVRAHLAWRDGALHVDGSVIPVAGRILVVGAGKASAPMAAAVEEILGDRCEGGPVVVKDGHGGSLARCRIIEAAHPVPDARGEAAAKELEAAVRGLGADDVVLFCLSGGASALLPAPSAGLTLADKRQITSGLLASGADIGEVNTVRRHLSRLKGGGLLAAAAPARVVTLAISDVPGDDPAVIGSGPTFQATTTAADALAILHRRIGSARIPPAVAAALAAPGPARDQRNGFYHIVASNRQAVAAAERVALERGHRVLRLDALIGEARAAGAGLGLAAALAPAGTVFLGGGETTVTLGDAPGRGGRNQEGALAAAIALEPALGAPRRATVMCVGTDGNDGPTDAAGGWADEGSTRRARAAGFEPFAHLHRHDAYPLLQATGDLLITGPTRTNVMDVWFAVSG